MTQRLGNPNPLIPTDPSLSGMPEEIIHELIRYNPDSVRALRAVSRALNEAGGGFLQLNIRDIFARCSELTQPLHHLVYDSFIRCTVRLFAGADRSGIAFHLSIPRDIRSLGVPAEACPDSILSVEEVAHFNDEVQQIQDANLQRAWVEIRWTIERTNHPLPEGIPGSANVSAQEIRAWMHANPAVLQRILELDLAGHPTLPALNLTCVPLEIGLFTGLERLDLKHNQPLSLPEGIFSGLSRLRNLELQNNQLTSLPERIFQGLHNLEELHLENNQLTSLPEGSFQGLDHLGTLNLSHNQLASLPGGDFPGAHPTGDPRPEQQSADLSSRATLPGTVQPVLSLYRRQWTDLSSRGPLPGAAWAAVSPPSQQSTDLASRGPPGRFARPGTASPGK